MRMSFLLLLCYSSLALCLEMYIAYWMFDKLPEKKQIVLSIRKSRANSSSRFGLAPLSRCEIRLKTVRDFSAAMYMLPEQRRMA